MRGGSPEACAGKAREHSVRQRIEPRDDGLRRVLGRERARVPPLEHERIAQPDVPDGAAGVRLSEGAAGKDGQIQQRPFRERALDEPKLRRLEPARRRERIAEQCKLDRRKQHIVVLALADVRHQRRKHAPGAVPQPRCRGERRTPERARPAPLARQRLRRQRLERGLWRRVQPRQRARDHARGRRA